MNSQEAQAYVEQYVEKIQIECESYGKRSWYYISGITTLYISSEDLLPKNTYGKRYTGKKYIGFGPSLELAWQDAAVSIQYAVLEVLRV